MAVVNTVNTSNEDILDDTDNSETFDKILEKSLYVLKVLPTTSIDTRLSGRLIRLAAQLRKRFDKTIFLNFLKDIQNKHKNVPVLISVVENLPIKETGTTSTILNINHCSDNLYLYLSLITLTAVIDTNSTSAVSSFIECLLNEIDQFSALPKYDELILAKIIFYIGRVLELNGKLPTYISYLFRFYRTGVRYNHKIIQAVSINTILRIYVTTYQYEQAVKFLSKIKFPENLRSNAQQARYLYYLGRILVVRLNYSEGKTKIAQALRRAPQEQNAAGRGFRVTASKLLCVTELLLGEISDRMMFLQKDIRSGLEPYSQIVQAVRSGDLNFFNGVMEKYEQLFESDNNYILIQRLRHNVIRSGLQKIAASYLRISFSDVASKLGLQESDDTECIISKAIADDVINASICSDTRTMTTKVCDTLDSSIEPRKQLQNRIGLCTQLYNDFLKAMQYPETEQETKFDEIEARRKEHQKQLANAETEDAEEAEDGNLY